MRKADMAKRIKNKGLLLLRRSGDRQETSLEKQLNWAAAEAARIGVPLDATLEDVLHMQAHGLYRFKSIRLDDAIPGDDLERPGLTALLEDVAADPGISHVFVFHRDRLGRPQSPLDMMTKEVRLLQSGATVVYPNAVVELPASGQVDIGELVRMLVDYHVAGEHSRKLAEQMVNTQRLLAQRNRTVGGTPPYGFVRALIDDAGQILEVMPKGKRVRQLGCHVVWIPDQDSPEKLGVWITMLELKEQGWGYKRIANYLNAKGIPSPGAGAARTDHGVKHALEGKWAHTTVKALLENRTILALFDYGRRSEGKLRRLGPDGPRFVADADINTQGRPRSSGMTRRCTSPASCPSSPSSIPAGGRRSQRPPGAAPRPSAAFRA